PKVVIVFKPCDFRTAIQWGRQQAAGPTLQNAVTLRLPVCDWYADLRADYFAGNHFFSPPILLPSIGGLIGGHWLSLAESLRRNRTPIHPLHHEVIADRRAAVFGKLLIIVIPADAVRVTFHVQPQARMPGDDAGDLGQLLAGQGP